MILPVYVFGQPVLKKKGRYIEEKDLPEIVALVESMWETMYTSHGVGLAAQQIGRDLRLFIIDSIQVEDDMLEGGQGFKKVFLNSEIIEMSDDWVTMEEGCLSFPDIRGNIDRPERITLRYRDLDFNEFTETFEGFNARVIQHEYDHTMGDLFIEKFKPLKKRMLKKRLDKIKTGDIEASYPIKVYRK